MAHFIIAADADPVRRNQFAQNVRKKLATLPGLIVRHLHRQVHALLKESTSWLLRT